MPAATATNGRSSRSGPSSKGVVVLKLSPDLLSRFASPPPPEAKERKKSNVKDDESRAESPIKEKEPSSPASSFVEAPILPSDNASDAASTPAAGTSAADTPRRKGVPGPKPGVKRGLNQISETTPKPRGKPGPKKKPRLDDGTSEPVKIATSHRLGPKANTGAINAGLRALDRSGTPCRKWERKSLQLKSFTGIQWQLPTWRTPRPQKTDDNNEIKESVLETGDSDSKANQSASGVPSEKSNSGDGDLTPVPPNIAEASSPAIAMAA
ncbi:INO80 complex, subunit Ies4 [Aspergillus bertholletiae]|uniref:INO80 complex, subunit Ies4 n=1 Tax=Aspergillus bertholletiae TaxID=1226010 RepID=A0A5N7B600_9EURO|nr:INO80 complex, subunit Ies4 [Aspergillus bertholletiae]